MKKSEAEISESQNPVNAFGFSVDYEGLASKYAEPLVFGTVKYPKLLQTEDMNYMPPFEDGDRVVFIGDSHTHGSYGGYYVRQLFTYYATRYPNIRFSYINKGINGDTVPLINSRFEHDICDSNDKPHNKAVLLIGTNDMARTAYFVGMENEPDAERTRLERFNKYEAGLEALVERLKARGLKQIILLTPPIFDEWLWYELDTDGNMVRGPGYANKPTSVDFNNVKRRGGHICHNVAKKCCVDFVDTNTPQTKVQLYNRFDKNEKENTSFSLAPDRVHDSDPAQYIATFAILKAQGESGEVASVNINAETQASSASNAAISGLSASANRVEYIYKPNSLPLAATAAYRTAETYFPITDELNREIIKVTGLDDGIYDIKIDGELVMQASAAQLCNGVNIADKENNPGMKQALIIDGIADTRRSKDAEYRDFISKESRSFIPKFGLDATNNQTLIASAESYINDARGTSEEIAAVREYLDCKKTEEAVMAEIFSLEDAAYEFNKPTEHKVLIEKSNIAKEPQLLSAEYFDYKLPKNTVEIKPGRI